MGQSRVMHDPAPLRLTLRSSSLARVSTLVGVISTSILVAWLPMEAWQQALIVVALGAYGMLVARTWAERTAMRAVVGIELGADRRIAILERGGRRIEGEVLDDSYVGSTLTTIVWRSANTRFAQGMALLPDMLRAEEYRRLRILLRLGKASQDRE